MILRDFFLQIDIDWNANNGDELASERSHFRLNYLCGLLIVWFKYLNLL